MTPDLTYLAWSAALTGVLWIPYILGRFMVIGLPTADLYRDPSVPELPAWLKRCDRVHLNAVESLVPFASVVLVAHVAGLANETTALWAMVYFWARVAHAVVYWLGIPFVRTLAFAAGLIATLMIFLQIAI